MHALLGMPSYGNLTAGAARGLYRATSGTVSIGGEDKQLSLTVQNAEASLLAQCFNVLWSSALNMAHRGEPIDYFAMIHADIEPQDFWLDELIGLMESHQLDVLGAVAPIKDPKGLTSIAVDSQDGDTWAPKCRLTMREVYRLPEVFTSEDVGGPLLLNTGLWVCRFDPAWAKKVHFTINDRIVFDRQRDAYVPQVEPEDWYFSRLCHELDLKVGATRSVALNHRGSISFTNASAWGSQEFDQEYIDSSVLDARQPLEV